MVDFDSLVDDSQKFQNKAPLKFDDLTDDSEKYSTPGQMALTGVEGTAQGLAGPVATAAEAGLSKLGVPGLTPQDQEARAKANPVTRYGSEAAGFGASSLYGVGEAGLLSKLGKGAVEAADLGKGAKIANSAIHTGAEFGALQAGNEVSKAINQDPDQTLGGAAINIGLSGILGAAGGAALGSVGPMWKSYTNAAAKDAGVGTAEIAEGEHPLTSAILKPKEKESFLAGLKKQKPEAQDIMDAGQRLGVDVAPSQTSASDYVQSMDSALSQSPTIAGIQRQQQIDNGFEKIGGLIDNAMGNPEELSPYERGQRIKDQVQEKVDNLYQPLKEKYAARGTVGDTIDLPDSARLKQYDSLVELSQKFAKANPQAEKMVRDAAEGILRQDTVSDLDEYMKVLSGQERNLRSGPTPDHYSANALKQAIDSMDEFQVGQIAKQGRALGKDGAEHAEAIANDIINEHKRLKGQYAEFKGILGDLASDTKLGKRATTAGGIEDVLSSIPNEKLVDKFFDPKNSDGLKRLQEKFPDVFKTVVEGKKADLIAAADGSHKKLLESVLGVNNKGAAKLSPEIRAMMFTPEQLQVMKDSKTWIDALPKNVGPSGTPKGMAYMGAVHDTLFSTLFHNVKDLGIKSLLRFATPAEIEANKTTSEYLQNGIKGEKLLDRASKAFLKSGEILPQHLIPNEKSRDRLKKQLDAMSENPNAALDVGGNIGHYLPQHATAAGMMTGRAVSYLASLKPLERQGLALDRKPVLDKAAEAKYNRALDIAEQPLLVLKHAKEGRLQMQDIQTLNTIYPSLRGQIASKLSQELIDHVHAGKPVPYAERQSLSMLTGSPLDSSMTPQTAQSIMQSNASQQTSQTQGPSKSHKASGTELNQINKTNQLYLTASEQRQMNKKA